MVPARRRGNASSSEPVGRKKGGVRIRRVARQDAPWKLGEKNTTPGRLDQEEKLAVEDSVLAHMPAAVKPLACLARPCRATCRVEWAEGECERCDGELGATADEIEARSKAPHALRAQSWGREGIGQRSDEDEPRRGRGSLSRGEERAGMGFAIAVA
ncbi:hypothetical protein DCS_00353 [Drechmeria coniospora]|uniref:Uncharacterized protein n=1 Tax=Drechmeria coniospora TaxID=98403 RepID=A0A151GQ53_DRECN|nr:hypothetical protein DCS_00353 [Drechmeria coniospora]KYK59223.1 hypothetical protein DCS_00353 [Drechmeria coniospora]